MRYFKRVFVLGVLLLPLSTLTSAQEPIATQTIELSKEESTIGELQRAAIRYAEVEPGKITNWRRPP